MLRRYTVEAYLEKLGWVREAIPDIALSTDIIVAFPGETDAEYEATLQLVRHVRFDDAFMYRYSPREGTPATRLPAEQFVPDDVARRRLDGLIELHREIQLGINRAELGRVLQVLVEKAARRGGLQGRTEGNKVVVFEGPESLIGSFADVRLVATTGSTFSGELLHGQSQRVA
jgi:tRNA-2-methylthio-N6-dimethylallyladenosine synthase